MKWLSKIVYFLLCCALWPATTASAINKETQVKAAILYNLARFSEWTENPPNVSENQFSICVLNDKEMLAALRRLGDRNVHGQSLTVVYLPRLKDLNGSCHVLFIPEFEESNRDLKEVAARGMLTVGESADFLDRSGAMIVRRYNNKMRFSINRDVMNLAGITPSSKILNLSAEVR